VNESDQSAPASPQPPRPAPEQHRWHRTWHWVSAPLKAITWLAALLAAITALYAYGPAAYRFIAWRQVEYDVIENIHAGFNIAYIDEKLGKPAMVKAVTAQRPLTQYIYLRRDYVVMADVDSAGEVELYSVLSCDASFAPTFAAPDGTLITLQSQPLDHAAAWRYPKEQQGDPNKRLLAYYPRSTADSLGQELEYDAIAGTSATSGTWTFVGYNDECGRGGDRLTADPSIWQATSPTNPRVKDFRAHNAANVYAETAPNSQLALDVSRGALIANGGLGSVQQTDGTSDELELTAFVSPVSNELLFPVPTGTTQTFG
jgi:hypothetical protein